MQLPGGYKHSRCVANTALHADDAHGQRITIQDIERHMDSAGGKLIVKHIPIDVLK